MVDSGDTFVPLFSWTDDTYRSHVIATANFIVDSFNASGFDAMTIGDRDLLLGDSVLKSLAKRATFPILSANVVVKSSGEKLLAATSVRKVGGARVGFFGVMSHKTRLPGHATLAATPYLPAAEDAVKNLEEQGVDIIIALSHLTNREEKELARKLPQITAILGSQTVSMQKTLEREGRTFLTNPYSKGKYVGLLTFHIHKGRAASAPFVDRYAAASLEQRIEDMKSRMTRYAGIVERQKKAVSAPKTKPGARPSGPASRSTFYQSQITKLNADIKLAEMALADLPPVDVKANFVRFELAPLGRDIVHAPSVEKRIQAFRKKVPSLSGKKAKRPPPGPRSTGPGPRKNLPGLSTPRPPKLRP